jgi:hypothetical protein
MPTTIPLRAIETLPVDGLASFCLALLQYYGVLALGALALTAVEMRLGMYTGLTIWSAILETTGTGLATNNFPGALM